MGSSGELRGRPGRRFSADAVLVFGCFAIYVMDIGDQVQEGQVLADIEAPQIDARPPQDKAGN
jgi:hypothetical protein